MKPEEKRFVTEDDDEFTFLFDMGGLIAAEDAADAPLKKVIQGAADGRLGYLGALVYGGLKAHHPGMTRGRALELIESDGEALGNALWPALFSSMPKAEGGANPQTAASGTGTRSSPPGAKKASPRNGSGSKRRAATPSS